MATMMIKIGDKVRFLNATGGGIVSKIVNKELVEVTDEDGFDIPTLVKECVLIESSGQNDRQDNTADKKHEENVRMEESFPEEEEYAPQEETPEGENLNVLLAFLPVNMKALSTTSYECYLVNDSNYCLNYNIAGRNNGTLAVSRATGCIQPNTKIFIEELNKEQLNELELLQIQLFAFKRSKSYSVKPVYDVRIKINPVKFYKLHSFAENDYFDEQALLFDIVSNDFPMQEMAVPEDLSKIIRQKEAPSQPKVIKKKEETPEIIEVDLHIHQLLDNLNGLTNADMLNCQMNKFYQTLQEHANRKGQKIVFIHGKGEGILRNEILKQLKSKYPSYYVQDASFREYGFGATMVTVR